jgi:hypothetical protein
MSRAKCGVNIGTSSVERAAQQKPLLVRQHIMEFKQAELGRRPSTD